MAGRRFDIRLAVGSATGPRSRVWAFWSRNSEVYAAYRSTGGVEKFSFHTPTLCRYAFTSEYGVPQGQSGRAKHSWHRGSTPQAGSNLVVRVLRIIVTTDHLSTKFVETSSNNVHWISPAHSGGATVIDLSFTNESEITIRELLKYEPTNFEHRLLAHSRLQNGEALAISTWHVGKAENLFRVLATPHNPRDLLILPVDPDNTGRPARFTLFSNPRDGDLMNVWEMGGFWHAPLTDAEWNAMCEPYKAVDAN